MVKQLKGGPVFRRFFILPVVALTLAVSAHATPATRLETYSDGNSGRMLAALLLRSSPIYSP